MKPIVLLFVLLSGQAYADQACQGLRAFLGVALTSKVPPSDLARQYREEQIITVPHPEESIPHGIVNMAVDKAMEAVGLGLKSELEGTGFSAEELGELFDLPPGLFQEALEGRVGLDLDQAARILPELDGRHRQIEDFFRDLEQTEAFIPFVSRPVAPMDAWNQFRGEINTLIVLRGRLGDFRANHGNLYHLAYRQSDDTKIESLLNASAVFKKRPSAILSGVMANWATRLGDNELLAFPVDRELSEEDILSFKSVINRHLRRILSVSLQQETSEQLAERLGISQRELFNITQYHAYVPALRSLFQYLERLGIGTVEFFRFIEADPDFNIFERHLILRRYEVGEYEYLEEIQTRATLVIQAIGHALGYAKNSDGGFNRVIVTAYEKGFPNIYSWGRDNLDAVRSKELGSYFSLSRLSGVTVADLLREGAIDPSTLVLREQFFVGEGHREWVERAEKLFTVMLREEYERMPDGLALQDLSVMSGVKANILTAALNGESSVRSGTAKQLITDGYKKDIGEFFEGFEERMKTFDGVITGEVIKWTARDNPVVSAFVNSVPRRLRAIISAVNLSDQEASLFIFGPGDTNRWRRLKHLLREGRSGIPTEVLVRTLLIVRLSIFDFFISDDPASLVLRNALPIRRERPSDEEVGEILKALGENITEKMDETGISKEELLTRTGRLSLRKDAFQNVLEGRHRANIDLILALCEALTRRRGDSLPRQELQALEEREALLSPFRGIGP